jgi:clan AA aspartic protease (TIGR02281 family)
MTYTGSNVSAKSITLIAFWVLMVGCISIGALAHAGEMYRWVDERGRIQLTDTPPPSKHDLQELKVYKSRETSAQPESGEAPRVDGGRAKLAPTKPGGVVVVEAVLNRRLTVPLLLDTGADMTILTKPVAKELWIPAIDRLPKMPFHTPGGVVNFPITTLQSLRVGTAEVRDVNVAIDTDGHLSVGLLGMSFLRHFKVTVDQQRGQVQFER